MPDGCRDASRNRDGCRDASRNRSPRKRMRRRRKVHSPVQVTNRCNAVNAVKEMPCLGLQDKQPLARAQNARLPVTQSARCIMVADICPGCGKRMGLISGLRGLGLLQRRHEARCKAYLDYLERPRTQGRPRLVRIISRASTDEADDACRFSSPPSARSGDSLHRFIQIGDRTVCITADIDLGVIEQVAESRRLCEWIDTIANQDSIKVSSIHIQSVDLFGLCGPKVGFVKCKVDALLGGRESSGIVFMRGGAAAVLMIFQQYSHKFALVVRRARLQVGLSDIIELPSGSVDENGRLAGIAAEAMEVMAGLEISENELIDMSFLAYGSEYPGVFTSPEAVYEHRSIYLYQRNVTPREMEDLRANLCGREYENIKLDIVPFETLWRQSPDAKALAASCLYHRLADDGRLPELPCLQDPNEDSWEISSMISSSISSSVHTSFASLHSSITSVAGMCGSI